MGENIEKNMRHNIAENGTNQKLFGCYISNWDGREAGVVEEEGISAEKRSAIE